MKPSCYLVYKRETFSRDRPAVLVSNESEAFMSETYLAGEKSGSIYTISLNRPDKRNAVTVEMLTGICEMAENKAADPDVRVIILKGEGKMFSAGVDFTSLGAAVAPLYR